MLYPSILNSIASRLQGELTEGVFVGRGCGVDVVDDGDKGGVNMAVYSSRLQRSEDWVIDLIP
jgi:hypothetical protein